MQYVNSASTLPKGMEPAAQKPVEQTTNEELLGYLLWPTFAINFAEAT
jgi:hypothetical protein